MNTKIDLKSALCGLALGVLAMLAIGNTVSPSNPVGRYQVTAGSGTSVIIDTTTGQAWSANVTTVGTQQQQGFFEKKTDK